MHENIISTPTRRADAEAYMVCFPNPHFHTDEVETMAEKRMLNETGRQSASRACFAGRASYKQSHYGGLLFHSSFFFFFFFEVTYSTGRQPTAPIARSRASEMKEMVSNRVVVRRAEQSRKFTTFLAVIDSMRSNLTLYCMNYFAIFAGI